MKLKKNIGPISNALENLLSLRGISFDWKDEAMGNKQELGVIAQEVEPVFPQLVSTIGDSKLVDYAKFVPVLIEAIRELREEVRTLKNNTH